MNLDLSSFAFGSTITSGGGTPSWGTSLGQSKPDYKFTYPDFESIVIGMLYRSVPLEFVSLPMGKGGTRKKASQVEGCQLASLFNKVFINGINIPHPFIMLLIKENSSSHSGRRGIKYSDKIEYDDKKSTKYSNSKFISVANKTLGISKNGCWFVYEMKVINQEELHMSTVIVNKSGPETYPDADDRKKKWLSLIPSATETYIPAGTKGSPKKIPLQKIYFGTPGSGKSYKVKELINDIYPDKNDQKNYVFRTTFHPDSDYASFVGCYKPRMDGKDIEYDYSPQAFTKAYVTAWQTKHKNVFLIIEEINRGNCAQIFGDLFQLLDRKDGESEYPINAEEDLKQYLEEVLGVDNEGITGGKLKLPRNLKIIATMNTSDQSLFPMDSAFKRRWVWECVPINYDDKNSSKFEITIDATHKYKWCDFLNAVNDKIFLVTDSEDKQMGNYFINGDVDERQFIDKVMFYLWNDICKDEYHSQNYFLQKETSGMPVTTEKFTFNMLFEGNSADILIGFMEYLKVNKI